MLIGKGEVIVLYGGDLGEGEDRNGAESALTDALTSAGYAVSGVLSGVDQGVVNGDDGRGYTSMIISKRDEVTADEQPRVP